MSDAIPKNLAYLRGLTTAEMPDFGPRLYETLTSILQQQQNITQQLNGNQNGQPQNPPQINGLSVNAQNGHFQIAIADNNEVYRGIQYFVEHADNPDFRNSHTIKMGDSRNNNEFLGNTTRYFRAYSSYGSSAISQAVYHGGAQPIPVTGGGSVGGPAFLESQGSGTGAPGQGLSGPGPVPFRTTTGVPPTR